MITLFQCCKRFDPLNSFLNPSNISKLNTNLNQLRLLVRFEEWAHLKMNLIYSVVATAAAEKNVDFDEETGTRLRKSKCQC